MNGSTKVALIDGDLIAYKASSAVQKDIDWGDGLWTCHAYLDDAIAQFKNILEVIQDKAWELEGLQFDDIRFAFSDSINFRYGILPSYKSNRSGKRKPTCYKALVDWIKDNYKTYTFPKLEGDDVLGILSTEPQFEEYRVIISMDKDFKTIAGKFFDFGREEFYDNTNTKARYWHAYQTLVGDTTDGYKGCPGFGDIKAKKALATANPNEYWGIIVEAFKKQGLTEEDALVQARCAYILQWGDYDLKTGEIKLWLPQ